MLGEAAFSATIMSGSAAILKFFTFTRGQIVPTEQCEAEFREMDLFYTVLNHKASYEYF